jgi:hypothetical protein
MLNLFKILFVVNFIKSNKRALFYIVVLIALLLISPYLFDDIFQFISKKDKAFWVFTKWGVFSFLIITIVFKCYKIFTQSSQKISGFLEPDESDNIHRSLINKKLQSKGEKIKNKYRVKQ